MEEQLLLICMIRTEKHHVLVISLLYRTSRLRFVNMYSGNIMTVFEDSESIDSFVNNLSSL